MVRQIQKGSANISVELYIIDDTDGAPETGVVFDTAGIDLNFRRDGAAVVSITEIDLTTPSLTDAHEDGGFLHVSNGRYRLDIPDAAFATGISQVTVGGTVTGMVVLPITIQLVDFDPDDAVRMGLTALPNAAADGVGGLPISDAGGLDLDAKLANTNEVTVARMGALTDWIDGGRLDLLLDAVLLDTGTTLDGKLNTIDDFLDTEVAAILAAVDTEVAAILVDTGTTLPALIGTPAADLAADIAAVKAETALTVADTNELQTDWANGGRLDLIIDAVLVDTGTTLDDHLTDIKGTAFVKDTHSLIDIETFVDLIDDGTSGLAKIATDVAAVLVDTGTTIPATITTIDDFLDTEVAAILAAVDTEVAAILTDTGTTLPGQITAVFTDAMTESYRSTGATGSPAQVLYEILAGIGEFAISGTTKTAKKLDGSTTAKTYTLDDDTNPTSITEAT